MLSTGLVPFCVHTLLADWEDPEELESLLSFEDITGVEVARNLVIFLNLAAFSSDLICIQ